MKTNVPVAEMALLIHSAMRRGDGDLVVVARCTKGWMAARALVWAWSMVREVDRQTVENARRRDLVQSVGGEVVK